MYVHANSYTQSLHIDTHTHAVILPDPVIIGVNDGMPAGPHIHTCVSKHTNSGGQWTFAPHLQRCAAPLASATVWEPPFKGPAVVRANKAAPQDGAITTGPGSYFSACAERNVSLAFSVSPVNVFTLNSPVGLTARYVGCMHPYVQ